MSNCPKCKKDLITVFVGEYEQYASCTKCKATYNVRDLKPYAHYLRPNTAQRNAPTKQDI